jgi:hypothetical protein
MAAQSAQHSEAGCGHRFFPSILVKQFGNIDSDFVLIFYFTNDVAIVAVEEKEYYGLLFTPSYRPRSCVLGEFIL